MKARCLVGFFIGFFALMAYAVHEPILQVNSDNTLLRQFTESELRQRKDLETITVTGNPAFSGKSQTYTAIKLCRLLDNLAINSKADLEFIATDGYASLIPAALVVNCSPSSPTAYLAIEPKEKWPPLPHGTGTAGPFDIVWQQRGNKPINEHYWPWQVSRINIKLTSTSLPAPTTTDKRVLSGYHLYIQQCAMCHTLNGIGSAKMGPDLNRPQSPVQYFKNDTVLKQYIRNPQSIREYKNDRMPGIGDKMSESELNDLIRFFHFMAEK